MESFEIAALNALDVSPAPAAFDFKIAGLRFRGSPSETQYVMLFEVPSRNLRFAEDPQKGTFRTHVSFLALVKNEQGQVVEKLSRDVPFEAKLDRKADFQNGKVVVTLPMRLAPGHYRLEAAADFGSERSASSG